MLPMLFKKSVGEALSFPLSLPAELSLPALLPLPASLSLHVSFDHPACERLRTASVSIGGCRIAIASGVAVRRSLVTRAVV